MTKKELEKEVIRLQKLVRLYAFQLYETKDAKDYMSKEQWFTLCSYVTTTLHNEAKSVLNPIFEETRPGSGKFRERKEL
jgi:hypothetical protein